MRTTLLFLCFVPLFLQGQSALLDSVQTLQELIFDVQVNKDNFRQQLEVDEDQPYRIAITITEVDPKGKEKKLAYHLNLALLDPNLIKYEDGKDQIRINLRSTKGEVIKVYEDGELDGYEKEAFLLALNIDNAREMEQLLRNIVPIAVTNWEHNNTLPEAYEDLLNWVQDHVISVKIDQEEWEQKWSVSEDHATRVQLSRKEPGGDYYNYYWNLADVKSSTIKVGVKGKFVRLEMGTTKKARFIRVEENGELDNYDNEIELLLNDVDEAQIMASALGKLVELARKESVALQPSYETSEAVLSGLKGTMSDFKIGDEEIRQSITGNCHVTYELNIEDRKGRKTQKAIFDFADISASSVEIIVKGKTLNVVASTVNSVDYVYYSENDEQQNYDDEISIAASNLPEAKLLQFQVMQLAEKCSNTDDIQNFAWIKKQLGEINKTDEEASQELDLLQDNDCKWSFTQRKAKGKGTEENRYEFNLYDLDAHRVELVVKGKTVGVTVPALRKEEIIKNYRNNEELGYEDELAFWVNDVSSAKVLVTSLKDIIGTCKQ